jgi:hypothetical protein
MDVTVLCKERIFITALDAELRAVYLKKCDGPITLVLMPVHVDTVEGKGLVCGQMDKAIGTGA